MKYLLIDFGASYIKTIHYNSSSKIKSDYRFFKSPFIQNNKINKRSLLSILQDIIKSYNNVDAIVICSILGGFYIEDEYYCWKVNSSIKNECLISGLFKDSKYFHIHEHHKNTTEFIDYENGLKILSYIDNIPLYSALSDTGCVIEALNLQENEIGINMGTGSQVFYKQDKKTIIHSFIPSGRAFFVFENFFKELNFDFFSFVSNLTIEDIKQSSLLIDLNIFEQSYKYNGGGFISLINENNFNIKNLISSIIKSYINQYSIFIKESKKSEIILAGGIPKKVPVIKDILSYNFPNMKIKLIDDNFEATHLGMISMIEKFL